MRKNGTCSFAAWFLDSVADIAKHYGISESKVKTTLFRCRNRLREYLNKEGYTV